MKITCDSCGSKYTIADEKVQGRKVKVRCKNCGANILVDGTQPGSTDESVGAGSAPAGPDQWTVNLSDEDSRDMSTDEIVAGWASGLVTEDAYVWRDGMSDWKPVLEVAELKMKLVVHRGAASPRPADAAAAPDLQRAPSISTSAALPATAGGFTAPTAARPAAQRPQDDLFSKGWGASAAAGDDEGKRPTGARNENSVLFSLDALKAAPAEPKPKKPAPAVDDLFAMGTMPGGGLLTANVDLLTAPAQAPPPAPISVRSIPAAAKKGGGALPIILGAAVVVLGLGGGYYFLSNRDNAEADAKVREAQAEAEKKLKEAEEERKKLEADLAKVRAEAQARGEDPAEAEKKAKEALAKGDTKEPAKPDTTSEPAGTAATPAKDAPSATATPSSGSTASATPAKDTKPAAPASGGGGKPFDVSAAKAALSAAAANASSCAKPGGPTGSGKVQVTFAPSGRVTTATIVAGPFGGTSVGGCISSTFKRARVPAFDGSPTSVAKSFKI